MIVEWSLYAIEDRTLIFDYIELDDPLSAIAVDERIMQQTTRLIQFPESGRPGRVTGTRELIVTRTSFIVVYRVLKDSLRILRILHSAQSWPDSMPEK